MNAKTERNIRKFTITLRSILFVSKMYRNPNHLRMNFSQYFFLSYFLQGNLLIERKQVHFCLLGLTLQLAGMSSVYCTITTIENFQSNVEISTDLYPLLIYVNLLRTKGNRYIHSHNSFSPVKVYAKKTFKKLFEIFEGKSALDGLHSHVIAMEEILNNSSGLSPRPSST